MRHSSADDKVKEEQVKEDEWKKTEKSSFLICHQFSAGEELGSCSLRTGGPNYTSEQPAFFSCASRLKERG